MDVAFGDFTLTEREALFEEASHSIEFIWQDGIDDKAYDNDKSSSRSRKLAKQRAVPVGTASAVQFSEKCLRQEGGGVKVDGEIIFQAPIAPTDGRTTTEVCASENKEGNQLAEVQAGHESPLNEETSSFLNVAAPEFVPEATPTEIKDEEEEETIAVNSSSDVSSSQAGQSHKHRHFNKHQAYPYHAIPDYMARGPPFPPLHLPYAPYLIPRHPREPLIPMGMPIGYPYPPMHLQQSRMFPDGFPTRHPQIYAAGIPSEIYMMDFMGPFPQDVQNRHYPWGGAPEQTGQSPEPNYEAHDDSPDDGDATQEVTSPNTNVSDTTEPRSHDDVTLSEDSVNQYPVTSSSDVSQFATTIEHKDPQLLDDTSSTTKTEVFNEEIHPIKDNSTGQVVDNGYIHKDIDSSHEDKIPPSVASKASLELDSSSKSDLDSSSEKAEVTELSQDILPVDNTVLREDICCTVTTVVDASDPAKQSPEETARQPPDKQQLLEDAPTTQVEHVTKIVKPEPQPTITPISVDNDNKVVPEERSAAACLPVVVKKLPNTALGNNSSEQKVKPPAVTGDQQQQQQHKVDRKTSYNNSRTSNQFSSSRENNCSRTDSQSSTSSGKISSKGPNNKSGPSIILRAANVPEKKLYQQMPHIDSIPVNTSGNRDTSHSSSGASVTELKKIQSNTSSMQSISKETSNPSMAPNNNSSSNVQNNSQVEVKKSHTVQAWGQTKKWSQLFNNGASSKDTVPPSKDLVQGNPIPSTSPSDTVAKQASTPPNPEHVNRQMKSLGEQLKSISVDHKSLRPFQPRGLINRGNMCYVHTTLQVLLSCPSVYNLFSSLNQFPILSKEPSATPLTDCMIQFTNQFSITEADWEANQKAIRKRKGGRDIAKGTPFQPDYVYSVLHKMHSSLTVRGKQEDAEEFLGSILDGLHEEMVEAKKAASPPEGDAETTAGEVLPPTDVAVSDEADEWEEVGHKNKSTITRVVSSFAESHITEIFGGKMRSAVHHQGAKESATVQPFFTLPLDIQASDVTSVEEALCRLAVKEPLHGFTCSKTQTEVEAFKRITLSKLPSVLILHLKRFLFNQTGGSQKVSKEISYPLELEIPKELLAPTLIKGKNKTYRLTGVIYHHGKYAAGGHYTCDAYHSSCGGWIRLDDSIIKPITDEQVVKHYKERTPYLLFYQKSDNISYNR